jgi:hypothetical protein
MDEIVTNGLPVGPTGYGSELAGLMDNSLSNGPRLAPIGMLDRAQRT